MANDIIGDLVELGLNQEFAAIIHGCNCFCTMESGIAVGIRKNFHEAWLADLKTKKGDIEKLGTFSYAESNGITVINAYTQFHYQPAKDERTKQARYKAIEKSMRSINKEFSGLTIGLPYIGAGLAGGDWSVIRPIIEKEMVDCDITFVKFWKDSI